MVTITTRAPVHLADFAAKMRMLAALADPGSGVTFTLSCDGARAVAQAVDGGGFAGAVEAAVAARLAAAAEERVEWLAQADGKLSDARRALRKARFYFFAGLVWFLVSFLLVLVSP